MPAGQKTTRLAALTRDSCKAVNTQGTVNNSSRQVFRSFATNSLLGTRDVLLGHGAGTSRGLRATQETQLYTHFPAFQAMKYDSMGLRRSESTPTLPRSGAETPNGEAGLRLSGGVQFLPPEVVAVGAPGVRVRHLLPAAGVKSEANDKVKISNYSMVSYNFIADQATPARSFEKTLFMSQAHRD